MPRTHDSPAPRLSVKKMRFEYRWFHIAQTFLYFLSPVLAVDRYVVPEVGMLGYIRKGDIEVNEECNLMEIFTNRQPPTVFAVVLEDSMLAVIGNIYMTYARSHFQWIYWKDAIDIGSDILTKHNPSRWITLNPHCRIRKTQDHQHPVTIRPLQNSDKLSKPSVEKIQKLMAKLNEPTAKSSYFNERVIFGSVIEVGMLFTVKHEFINEGCRELIPEEDLQRGTLMVLVHNIEEDSKSSQPPRTHIWPFISSQPPASEHVTAILWKANAFGHWGLNAFLSQTRLNPKNYLLMHKYLDCFLVGNGDSSFYGTWQPQKPKYVHVTYPWYASPNPSHHHSHPLFKSENVKIAARPLKIHANTLQFMHKWQEATHDYNRKEIAKQAASFFASAGGSEGLEAA